MPTTANDGMSNQNSLQRNSGAGTGIFVFEADTAAFANRKRAARACASCQKRKKRCPHTFTKSQDSDQTGNGAEKVLPHLTHKEPVRFVGDLNPESIMKDLDARDQGIERFSRVGIWVEQSRLKAELLRRDEEIAAQNGHLTQAPSGDVTSGSRYAQRCAVERYSKIERGRRTLTGHQKNYLQAVGAFRVLPKATEDALVTTYIACIDPLLPIVDGIKFLKDYTAGEASVFLVQAICLVACKTEEAAAFLRLYEDGPLLDPIPFARSLHTGLDAAMKADLEADRFTKVQIMALMSLHNDGPGGIEESSLNLVQAVHDAQTTGMHIDTPGRTRNDQGAQTWWTLWLLDKYNACLGGRPLIIAERDVDIQEPTEWTSPKSQALQIWLALGHLLDQVIEFYRPIADPDATGWESDFPTWEELTQNCKMDALLKSHISTLEICYNIIGILACRSGGPTTNSYNRRIACADRIQALISERNGADLPPLPLVPYAVSLSLTVAYRGLRDHHTEPTKALADLTLRCEMLEKFSSSWWTADAMAKLGRKALKSLQQPQNQSTDGQTHSNTGAADIGDALEAEVTACKFHPFSEKSSAPSKPSNNKKRSVQQSNSNTDLAGNALQVLSDAAATHGISPGTKAGKSLSKAEMNNNSDIQAKRRRVNPTRHANTTSPATISTPASHTDSSVNTPTLIHSTTATHIHTPSSFTQSDLTNHSQHHHHQHQQQSSTTTSIPTFANANTNPSSLLSPPGPNAGTGTDLTHNGTTTQFDPFGPFPMSDPSAFNDLDNLFEGFFDLSLPTMFQDPLFDGAAFFNIGADEDYTFMDTPVGATGTGTLNPTSVSTGTVGMGMGVGMGVPMTGGMGIGFVNGAGTNHTTN